MRRIQVLTCVPRLRDTTGPYTSEYPIPPLHITMHSKRTNSTNLAGNYSENVEGKQCEPLQPAYGGYTK